MAKMTFRRAGFGFVPADDAAQKFTARIKEGDHVMVEARRPRNLKHHRKLFKMLQIVCENRDGLTVEKLLAVVKIRTGYVDVIKTTTDEIQIPRSISFESIDQTEFEKFYDGAVAFIVTDVLPGVNRDELEAEVLRMAA